MQILDLQNRMANTSVDDVYTKFQLLCVGKLRCTVFLPLRDIVMETRGGVLSVSHLPAEFTTEEAPDQYGSSKCVFLFCFVTFYASPQIKKYADKCSPVNVQSVPEHSRTNMKSRQNLIIMDTVPLPQPPNPLEKEYQRPKIPLCGDPAD